MSNRLLLGGTKHRHLSNFELLRYISEARYQSPIVGELANRLECCIREDLEKDSDNNWGMSVVKCPCCEATLIAETDDAGTTLQVEK